MITTVLTAIIFACVSTSAETAEFVQLPAKIFSGAKGEEFTLSPFELAQPSTFSVVAGRNTMVLEISPDGTVRVARLIGAAECSMPVKGDNIEFQLGSSQRVLIWPISKMTFAMDKDVLKVIFTAPCWAFAMETEYTGPMGIEIYFQGKTGVLQTGQRMDSLLDAEGQVLLVRSLAKMAPAVPKEVRKKSAEQTRENLRHRPSGYAPPDVRSEQPTWTSLSLLPPASNLQNRWMPAHSFVKRRAGF